MDASANRPSKRLFHFANETFGLEDIARRRLKVARLAELNDPFELMALDLSDRSLRRGMTGFKTDVAAQNGLLCFSRIWTNPVMWGHYADRHRGLCLGFEVAADIAAPVEYSRRRLRGLTEQILKGEENQATMKQLLFTKFSHWRYEAEERVFVKLSDEKRDEATGHYFEAFSPQLKLAVVIAGAESKITRSRFREALGALADSVEIFKARPAFSTFRVVRNRNESLWT